MELDNEILDRYINGKATTEERKQVLIWLSTEEGQTTMALHLDKNIQMLTNETADLWLEHTVPTNRMRKRFMNNICAPRKSRVLLKVAAIVIPIVFLFGTICFLEDRLGLFAKPEYAVVEVPCGEQMQIMLQDGTLVHLNSSSRIRYPKQMGLFSRKIELSGEAYFYVAKDKGRPFIVELNGISIKVTGTQFNVKAYPNDAYVRVTLDEGGVSLEATNNQKYSLKPGECAGYDRNTGHCNISKVENGHIVAGWRSHSLIFYYTPLAEVLKTLEREYDVVFQIADPQLLNVHFTLSTAKAGVEDILDDLSAISNLCFIDTDSEGKSFIVSSKKK